MMGGTNAGLGSMACAGAAGYPIRVGCGADQAARRWSAGQFLFFWGRRIRRVGRRIAARGASEVLRA